MFDLSAAADKMYCLVESLSTAPWPDPSVREHTHKPSQVLQTFAEYLYIGGLPLRWRRESLPTFK